MNTIVFIIMIMIIFILSIYLGILVQRLRAQKLQMSRQMIDSQKYVLESLRIITLATIQGQCETSEACIRIHHLLERAELLGLTFPKEKLTVVGHFFRELSPFAYLEERNQLSKQEKFDQDKKRMDIENFYDDDFMKALNELYSSIKAIDLK